MPAAPHPLGKVPALVLFAAVLALALVAGAGPLAKHGAVTWQVALTVVKWGFFLAAATAVGALIVLALMAVPRFRARPAIPVLALCIALAAAAPPLIIVGKSKRVPPIHDVSTDTADPPAFVALLEERRRSRGKWLPPTLRPAAWRPPTRPSGSASRTTSSCACAPRARAAASTCAPCRGSA
jgi:hypothetical protein